MGRPAFAISLVERLLHDLRSAQVDAERVRYGRPIQPTRRTRKHRESKRRWKARCRLGREIPRVAIVEYGLNKWFRFECVSYLTEMYKASCR